MKTANTKAEEKVIKDILNGKYQHFYFIYNRKAINFNKSERALARAFSRALRGELYPKN